MMSVPLVTETEEEDAPPDPREAFYFPVDGEDDPRPMLAELVEQCEEFNHLRVGEAAIMIVMRSDPKIKNSRSILGEMSLPRFQGSMAAFALWLLAMSTGGTIPDFILTIDSAWWAYASHLQRCGLLHHELMHCQHATDREGELRFTDEGKPVWAILGHDIEEFKQTVERFGDFAGDVAPFVAAALRGGVKPNLP